MKSTSRLLIGFIFIWMGCVDIVSLSLPAAELPLIIDGLVTDEDRPFTVIIARAFPVDGNSHTPKGVNASRVVISDDAGGRDILSQLKGENGEYIAGGYVTDSLKGIIGRTYTLKVTMPDGLVIESTPELMRPAGKVDSIYFDYVETKNNSKGVTEAGFNIYVNSTFAPGSSRRMRWTFDGTYKIFTNPAAITIGDPPVPLACSIGCECCICYVSEREEVPILTSSSFTGGDQSNRNLVQHLPINNFTFNEKYRVEIGQMEVSQEVYDFYSGIKGQAKNASSLFQPPFFELKGNLKPTNRNDRVIGVFSAAAITRRHIYIYRADVPHEMFYTEIPGDCRAVVPYSVTKVPAFWE